MEVKQDLYKAWEAPHDTHTHTHPHSSGLSLPSCPQAYSAPGTPASCWSWSTLGLLLPQGPGTHWVSSPYSQTSMWLSPSPAASLYPSDTSQWGLPAGILCRSTSSLHILSIPLLALFFSLSWTFCGIYLFYITHYKTCFMRAEIIICFIQC